MLWPIIRKSSDNQLVKLFELAGGLRAVGSCHHMFHAYISTNIFKKFKDKMRCTMGQQVCRCNLGNHPVISEDRQGMCTVEFQDWDRPF